MAPSAAALAINFQIHINSKKLLLKIVVRNKKIMLDKWTVKFSKNIKSLLLHELNQTKYSAKKPI